MKPPRHYARALVCAVALFGASCLYAAEAKTYQVTGPVLALTPTTITVDKNGEKWEVGRTGSTKVTGDLKVGSKVTIYYRMVAAEVEVKESKGTKDKDTKGKKEQ